MSIISELKRRNVFRVAATYVVSAWLLIEIGNTLEDTLNLPEWADTFVAFLLIIGFPIVVFFSWAYEITPDGIKREKDIDPDDTSRAVTAGKLNRALLVIMALALGYFALDKFVFTADPAAQPIAGAGTPATTAPAIDEISDEGAAEEPVGTVPEKSIAVLPFVNMSSDPEQEYFSDGLTEELLNLLAGIEDLKVAARTSSFFYKDKLDEIPMKEVARQLEVAHILEGSVRKGGDKIRITAQLIKADDGFHLWSETYDRTMDDVFAIQDEIAAAVVEQLKITMLGEAPHQAVIDPRSYELALQGRFLFNRREGEDLKRAFDLFEQALKLDPANEIALVGISPLYLWLFDPPRVNDALAVVERALALNPDNPEALARKARALLRLENPPREEIEEVWEKAQAVGQNNPLVLAMRAGMVYWNGDIEQGLELQRKALANDPLHLVNIGNMANYLLDMGYTSEAEVWIAKLGDLAPDSAPFLSLRARQLLLEGRPQEAIEFIDSLPEHQDGRGPVMLGINQRLQLQVMAYHDLGNPAASEAALQELISEGNVPALPHTIARLYAYRDEPDEAFKWIGRLLEEFPDRPPGGYLFIEFEDLRDDPRWRMVSDHYSDFSDWEQGPN